MSHHPRRTSRRRDARALPVRLTPQVGDRRPPWHPHSRPARLAQHAQLILALVQRPGYVRRFPHPCLAVQQEGDGPAAALAHLGEHCCLFLVQIAEEGDQQPFVTAAQHVVRTGQTRAVRVVDDGECVHHQSGRVRRLRAGARETVRALARHRTAGVGQQPYRKAPFEHVHQCRRRARNRPLEGRIRARALEGDPTGVEQHRAAGALRLLLAADHQLAVARGQAPVHPAQIVAVAVAARDYVVLAGQRQRALPPVAVPLRLTGQPHRRQRLHARDDRQGVVRREGARQFAHSEGVREPQLQWAQRIAAAQVRAHPVGHLATAARLHPVQDEPGPRAEHVRHPVLEHQQSGGQPRDVVHAQMDPRLGTGGHARGGEPATAGDPVTGAVEHRRAHQRQHRQEQADPEQIALPQDVRADRGRDSGGQEGAAPRGEPGERCAQPALVLLGGVPRPSLRHPSLRGGCWP